MMRKIGCGLISYDGKLVLFGGYGYPSGPTPSGADFIRDRMSTDGRGYTNELHIFDLKEGERVDVECVVKVLQECLYSDIFVDCDKPPTSCTFRPLMLMLTLEHSCVKLSSHFEGS
jgi:hypothetical protein